MSRSVLFAVFSWFAVACCFAGAGVEPQGAGQSHVPFLVQASSLLRGPRQAGSLHHNGTRGRTQAQAIAPSQTVGGFDFAGRRASHWAWQPVRAAPVPDVGNAQWARDPIDRFILSKLRANRLDPAPEADRRTLIRRVSFALVGLPPTEQEVEAFVADVSPDAYEKVVDRLLASARFGERWARHWMDLVRYADTLGNESDAPIPNAWQYRDYLVRAFNADVPYDQFVTEHIAGDLLAKPRRGADGNLNESIIGTGFFWLNEGKRSPVDVRLAQADCFDNKIDVMCKTFLGLTVGCARCHDHKFDAITQADYYALYGYLKSSRYTQALLNAPDWDARASELRERKERLREASATMYLKQATTIARYLLAAHQSAARPADAVAAESGVSPGRLAQWVKAFKEPVKEDNPLFPWLRMSELGTEATPDATAARWREVVEQLKTRQRQAAEARHREGDIELADFDEHAFSGWFAEDQAFGTSPSRPGDFIPGNSAERPIVALVSGGAWAHSAAISRRLQGTLRSPTFTIERRYLHVHAAGRAARINVNVEQFVMIQEPLYGGLRKVLNDDAAEWQTFDLGMWKGKQAYVEFADTTTPDLHDRAAAGCGADGYLAIGRVLLSDQGPPAIVDPAAALGLVGERPVDTLTALAERYQAVAIESLTAFQKGDLPGLPKADARAVLLTWLIQHGLLDGTGTALDRDVAARLGEILCESQKIEAALPPALRAPATIDGTAEDEYVFIRGGPKTPGSLTPRRMLQAIGGDSQPPAPSSGSGRLELARQFSNPANPLVSRVVVNRAWHYLLGRGIVASVDNFGALGDRPTHPELLDYLADAFVQDGWSIKRLVRRVVLSSTFRMSSRGSPDADAIDPENKLFHRAMVRRLEGEAIRDQVLQISGRLDTKMYGPGIEVFLTPFLVGNYVADYGKPEKSGPLDGDGRRSVYMMVRRNFLPPMMVAFDTPPPINTAGRRSASNVPAQALILMNDPFVLQQAEAWAKRMLADEADATRRVRRMYLQAYCRPPIDAELAIALRFLDEHGEELGIPSPQRSNDARVWTDFAHVLMNVKEFVFLN